MSSKQKISLFFSPLDASMSRCLRLLSWNVLSFSCCAVHRVGSNVFRVALCPSVGAAAIWLWTRLRNSFSVTFGAGVPTVIDDCFGSLGRGMWRSARGFR